MAGGRAQRVATTSMTAVKAHGGAKFRTTPDSESVELRRELRLDAFDPEYRRFIRELTSCPTALEDQAELTDQLSDMFRVMAAWAWFSQRDELPGHRLLRRPWSVDMSFKRAREELGAWRQRLRLVECLGPGIESPWLADGTGNGFEFV